MYRTSTPKKSTYKWSLCHNLQVLWKRFPLEGIKAKDTHLHTQGFVPPEGGGAPGMGEGHPPPFGSPDPNALPMGGGPGWCISIRHIDPKNDPKISETF